MDKSEGSMKRPCNRFRRFVCNGRAGRSRREKRRDGGCVRKSERAKRDSEIEERERKKRVSEIKERERRKEPSKEQRVGLCNRSPRSTSCLA